MITPALRVCPEGCHLCEPAESPAKCPVIRGPPPGEDWNLWDFMNYRMRCRYLICHVLGLLMFMWCICLVVWLVEIGGEVEVTEGEKKWETELKEMLKVRQKRHTILKNCSQCITKVTQGSTTTFTLLHTNVPPQGAAKVGTCIHHGTQYDIYKKDSTSWCSNPQAPTRIKISVFPAIEDQGKTPQNSTWAHQGDTEVEIEFDACQIIGLDPLGKGCGTEAWKNTYKHNHKYLCKQWVTWIKGNPYTYTPCQSWQDCSGWGCVCKYTGGGEYSPTCPEIKDFTRTTGNGVKIKWKLSGGDKTKVYGLGIDGTGSDPLAYITIKQEKMVNKTEIKWSVYDTLANAGKAQIVSDKARNLFIEFAETVAKTIGVSNCFVCGGTNMGEQWPWEAIEASAEVLANLSATGNVTRRTSLASDVTWTLTTNLVGKACYKQNRTSGPQVGDLMCLGYWENGNWSSENANYTQERHNFTGLLNNSVFGNWTTPKNMYWVCGNKAYAVLPANWSGSCVLGWIKPSFFLIPLQNEQNLGIPLYDSWKKESRIKRELGTGIGGLQVGSWTDKDWTPERIVAYYDPASWAEDGSWGYRTPIYMLNRIIRLQAVLEIAGQRIDSALNTIATEQDKLRTAVYQNRLALDYLLANEGGVCGKFNLTNCCLQINPVGKVVADLTADLRRVIHVPVQKWTGLLEEDGILGGVFRNWKQALLFSSMILLAMIMLPCILPIIKNAMQSVAETTIQKYSKNAMLVHRQNCTIEGFPMTIENGSPPSPTTVNPLHTGGYPNWGSDSDSDL